jgi:hypothetical protein
MTNKDAFDLWWEWAEKPLDSPLTIDAEIHEAVMALPARPRKGQLGRPRWSQAWIVGQFDCGRIVNWETDCSGRIFGGCKPVVRNAR